VGGLWVSGSWAGDRDGWDKLVHDAGNGFLLGAGLFAGRSPACVAGTANLGNFDPLPVTEFWRPRNARLAHSQARNRNSESEWSICRFGNYHFAMAPDDTLSASELASLQEIAKGIYHFAIPEADAARLVELRFIYRLLGDLRVTTAGRIRAFRDVY